MKRAILNLEKIISKFKKIKYFFNKKFNNLNFYLFRRKKSKEQLSGSSANSSILNISSYQRPRQDYRIGSSQRTVVENNQTIIVLDSDEDEQDREDDQNIDSTNEVNRERELARRVKDEKITKFINSNRFFTNSSNSLFYKNFLNGKEIYVMDAKLRGNIGRYFNHSCTPNIFVQNVFVDTYDFRFPWIAFFTKDMIKAGTELCWDYRYEVGAVPGRELICHCNSNNCRGRLL